LCQHSILLACHLDVDVHENHAGTRTTERLVAGPRIAKQCMKRLPCVLHCAAVYQADVGAHTVSYLYPGGNFNLMFGCPGALRSIVGVPSSATRLPTTVPSGILTCGPGYRGLFVGFPPFDSPSNTSSAPSCSPGNSRRFRALPGRPSGCAFAKIPRSKYQSW